MKKYIFRKSLFERDQGKKAYDNSNTIIWVDELDGKECVVGNSASIFKIGPYRISKDWCEEVEVS